MPKILDARGALTFIESQREIPFEIKRVYYLYDLSGGASRAGHAHKKLRQVLIALSGSFDVFLDYGDHKEMFHLNQADSGLYLPSMVWRDLTNFSSGAVCLALVDDFYDASDYYRDYQEFLNDKLDVPEASRELLKIIREGRTLEGEP